MLSGGRGRSANPHAYDQIRDRSKLPNVLPNAFQQFYGEKIRDLGRNRTYNLWGTDLLL